VVWSLISIAFVSIAALELISVFVNGFWIHVALLCGLGIVLIGTEDSSDLGLFPGLNHGLLREEKIESMNENL
jgi:hypothetical protein